MHRLSLFLVLSLGSLASSACGGDKPPPADPSAKTESASAASATEGSEKMPVDETPKTAEKKDVCIGTDIANVEDLLVKSECEVPDTKPETVASPDMKGKLEVTVTASPAKVAPGKKADLLVTFTNKTKAPMTLSFRIDPVARFETETYDGKKKRAEMPTGQPPAPPKGFSAPPPADAKVAKVTIAPGGAAHARVAWDAVKTKWAPEKIRGTAVEKGFPRVPAGPLAKGKYTVKVLTPLIGVFEGGDHEVSAPKLEIEVG